MTEVAGATVAPETLTPLVEFSCLTDGARCVFAAWLNLKEDDNGRKNLFTLETACQTHKKSGTGQPTLAARKAGDSLLAMTMNRVRSARSHSPMPAVMTNGRGRGTSVAPAVPGMAQVSRLRYTKTPDEPNLPLPPLPDAPSEPAGNEEDLEEYLEALRPGLGTYGASLRAAGVDTVDTLLTLEDDEWSTLILGLTHHSDPPLSQPESMLLHRTILPLLLGRMD